MERRGGRKCRKETKHRWTEEKEVGTSWKEREKPRELWN